MSAESRNNWKHCILVFITQAGLAAFICNVSPIFIESFCTEVNIVLANYLNVV